MIKTVHSTQGIATKLDQLCQNGVLELCFAIQKFNKSKIRERGGGKRV